MRNAKANLEHHNVEIIACFVNGSGNLKTDQSSNQLQCSNDEVAEQHLKNKVIMAATVGTTHSALFSVKCRQEESHNLLDDNRCADNHREEKLPKPDTKTAKDRDNCKLTISQNSR